MVFPHLSALEVFAVASLFLLLVPGPAVLYIVAQSAEQGRSAGLASVAGVHVGTIVHIVAATVGLSALVVASATAFTVIKLAGAVYLIYVGVRKLLERETPLRVQRRTRARLFAQGVVVNVLNPKTALFFLAFLPQFVDPDRGAVWSQVVTLGLVFRRVGPRERFALRARRRCGRRPPAPPGNRDATHLRNYLRRARGSRRVRASLANSRFAGSAALPRCSRPTAKAATFQSKPKGTRAEGAPDGLPRPKCAAFRAKRR